MRLSGATRIMEAEGEAGTGALASVYPFTSNLGGGLVDMVTSCVRAVEVWMRRKRGFECGRDDLRITGLEVDVLVSWWRCEVGMAVNLTTRSAVHRGVIMRGAEETMIIACRAGIQG